MTTNGDNLIGQALTLADLVQYQAGAVVSRTLIDKQIGTLTLFAFDDGQGLSEHTAPYDAFVQIVDGAADVTIAGKDHRVVAGQMIIMPANVPHALRAVGRFKMLLVMIRA
ncbi:MAG: cupin domain-containing protein [Desulfuromonadales bacterium]